MAESGRVRSSRPLPIIHRVGADLPTYEKVEETYQSKTPEKDKEDTAPDWIDCNNVIKHKLTNKLTHYNVKHCPVVS